MEDVLFLYDQAMELLVRLHSYRCTKRNEVGGDGDVQDDMDSIADLLAKRDLLTFSASLRNFAEAAKTVDAMRALRLPTCKLIVPPQAPYFVQPGDTISLYQALSRIIHSHTLRILRSSYDFWLLVARTDEEVFSTVTQPVIHSETLLLLQTERDPATAIELQTLVRSACTFLNSASETLKITQRGDRIGV